jgi:hypothetical protein
MAPASGHDVGAQALAECYRVLIAAARRAQATAPDGRDTRPEAERAPR